MKWLGLTGGMGSGKSTVARLLSSKGYSVIGADQLVHDILTMNQVAQSQIVQDFGPGLLYEKSEIDRKKLGQLVFRDKQKLQKLEAILHPLVQEKVRTIRAGLEAEGKKIAFYDVPLLFEKGLNSQFDAVITVSCSIEQQIDRVMTRDSLTRKEVEERLSHQLPLSEKVRQSDYVLNNDKDLASLADQVDLMLQYYSTNK